MSLEPENRRDVAEGPEAEGFAGAYSAENETSLANAYYERPAIH